MSIAALSSTFAGAVRRSAAPPDAAEPVRAAPRPAREHGRRHELVAAMNQALGVEGGQDKASDQAVFRFAHSLMHDLRTMVGEETEGPRAWGRRDWGDLAQRLTALATAAAPPAPPAAAALPATPPVLPTLPVEPTQADTIVVTATPPVVAELPDAPNPLTTATAAVHIMKVPSSQLLEAFASLQRALGQQAASDPRAALAEMAQRLAAAVTPGSPSDSGPGAVVNLSA
jgi:hypothetical protein